MTVWEGETGWSCQRTVGGADALGQRSGGGGAVDDMDELLSVCEI